MADSPSKTALRERKAHLILIVMAVALGLTTIAAILFGSMSIPFSSFWGIVQGALGFEPSTEVPTGHRYIIVDLRLPRAILAIVVGGALSVAGAMMQGLFRNPLADPGLLGVSSGAALGAASVIVLGLSLPALPELTLSIAAFVGGVLATVVVMQLSLRGGKASVANMLLAGIAIKLKIFGGGP